MDQFFLSLFGNTDSLCRRSMLAQHSAWRLRRRLISLESRTSQELTSEKRAGLEAPSGPAQPHQHWSRQAGFLWGLGTKLALGSCGPQPGPTPGCSVSLWPHASPPQAASRTFFPGVVEMLSMFALYTAVSLSSTLSLITFSFLLKNFF